MTGVPQSLQPPQGGQGGTRKTQKSDPSPHAKHSLGRALWLQSLCRCPTCHQSGPDMQETWLLPMGSMLDQRGQQWCLLKKLKLIITSRKPHWHTRRCASMLSRHKGQRCAASLGLTSLGHLSVLNLVVSLTTFYNASEERNGASLNFGSAALVPLTESPSDDWTHLNGAVSGVDVVTKYMCLVDFSDAGSNSPVMEDIIVRIKGGDTSYSARPISSWDSNTYRRWGRSLKYNPAIIDFEVSLSAVEETLPL